MSTDRPTDRQRALAFRTLVFVALGILFLALLGSSAALAQSSSSLQVTATAGPPAPPSPAATGTPMTIGLSAVVLNPPQPSGSGYAPPTCPINGPFWAQDPVNNTPTAWSISVQYSASDPTSFGPPPDNSFTYMVVQPSVSAADAMLTFVGQLPGYWSINATAQVYYNDGACGDTWAGSGSLASPITVQVVLPVSNTLTVTAQAGATTPSWADVGQQTVTPVSATLVNPPVFVSGPMFMWSSPSALYSPDGSPPTPAASGSYYAYFDNPSAAATNFRVTMYNAGYWTFGLQVMAFGMAQQGSGTQPVSGMALASANAVAAAADNGLKIQRRKDGDTDYKDIDTSNNTLLAGEYVDLKAVDTAGTATITDVRWTVAETSFKDYTADNKNGTATFLGADDEISQTIQFYWVDDGAKDMLVQATVDGVPKKANATLTVSRPDSQLSAAQGDVYVGKYKTSQVDVPTTYLILAKDATGGLPGMLFTGKVTVPSGFPEGKWCLVQLLTEKDLIKTVVMGETVTLVRDTEGVKVLDTQFPYGNVFDTGTAMQNDQDSPGFNLEGKGTEGYTFVSLSNNFSMYILFKPAGGKSQWVPLRRLDWSWAGAAQKDDKTLQWSLKSKDKSMQASVAETNHPQWNKNIVDVPYKPQP